MGLTTIGKAARKVAARSVAISKAATEADGREKGADAETPAQVVRDMRHTVGEAAVNPPTEVSRSIATALPTRRPTSAVVIDLLIWKSSRMTEGRNLGHPAYRRSPREKARGTVIEWADHHAASRS